MHLQLNKEIENSNYELWFTSSTIYAVLALVQVKLLSLTVFTEKGANI
jgi:hypothetical protein